jgi:hypothetical protein
VIRIISIASLGVLLILVLYLPSAHPPERFVAQLRAEHVQTTTSWSDHHAERILTRTLDAQALAGSLSPVPEREQTQAYGAVGSAVGSEMSAVNARLFNSQYFRSIDALLVLATFRFFTLLEWLPWLGPFCLAAVVDGGVARTVKARQFVHHDPEMFALCVSVAIILVCGTAIALVLPLRLPPFLLPSVPLCLAVLSAAALSNFHSRG